MSGQPLTPEELLADVTDLDAIMPPGIEEATRRQLARDPYGDLSAYTDPTDQKQKELQRAEKLKAKLQELTKHIETQVDRVEENSESEDKKPFETGLAFLDYGFNTLEGTREEGILDGGIIPKSLVLLGAAPGMGKTTLAQQIIESMAIKHKRRGFFICLETDEEFLIAKSVSRIMYQEGLKVQLTKNTSIYPTAKQVWAGWQYTDKGKTPKEAKATECMRNAVREGRKIYRETVGKYVTYNMAGKDATLDGILLEMDAMLEYCRLKGEPAPFVCTDYLQIIEDERDDPKETIKHALKAFKTWAETNNTIVFCITAFGRETNKSGTVTLESGRDTSNIEYSANLYLGMEFAAVEEKAIAKAKAKANKGKPGNNQPNPYADAKIQAGIRKDKDEKHRVRMRLLKDKLGDSNTDIILYFNGASNIFETEKDHKDKMEEEKQAAQRKTTRPNFNTATRRI